MFRSGTAGADTPGAQEIERESTGVLSAPTTAKANCGDGAGEVTNLSFFASSGVSKLRYQYLFQPVCLDMLFFVSIASVIRVTPNVIGKYQIIIYFSDITLPVLETKSEIPGLISLEMHPFRSMVISISVTRFP